MNRTTQTPVTTRSLREATHLRNTRRRGHRVRRRPLRLQRLPVQLICFLLDAGRELSLKASTTGPTTPFNPHVVASQCSTSSARMQGAPLLASNAYIFQTKRF